MWYSKRMKFTPLQVREILGISEETLRYWKRSLPVIADRKGYSPCYTFGDLVSMEVIGVLIRQFGVAIGAIAPAADRLFSTLERAAMFRSSGEILVITGDFESIKLSGRFDVDVISAPAIVLPLHPIVENLQDKLFGALGGLPPQLPLALPPANLTRSSGNRS